jgi:hypothetical protein
MDYKKLIVGKEYLFTLDSQVATYCGIQTKPEPGMEPRHIFVIKGDKIPLSAESVKFWIE